MKRRGVDVVSVTDYGRSLPDAEVVELGRSLERTIITFDKDFGELVYKSEMRTFGVILLRIRVQKPIHVAEAILDVHHRVRDLSRRFIVLEEGRIRVSKLEPENNASGN